MNLFVIRKQVDKILLPVVSGLARIPLNANQWTLMGAFVGLACGVAFLYGKWWIGLALLILRGIIDHTDGYVARNRNQRSTFGAVMDDVTDRWVLGIIYAGGCLYLSIDYPHILIVLGFGITGSLSNALIKLSVYAESQQDVFREHGKIGHPIDVVGLFGSAEFIIYFGFGVLFTAILDDPRPLLAGCWAVAIMSHVSLLQRVGFAWRRYRRVDPASVLAEEEEGGASPTVG
jgi:phosphatidylglycerophosphate synthase